MLTPSWDPGEWVQQAASYTLYGEITQEHKCDTERAQCWCKMLHSNSLAGQASRDTFWRWKETASVWKNGLKIKPLPVWTAVVGLLARLWRAILWNSIFFWSRTYFHTVSSYSLTSAWLPGLYVLITWQWSTSGTVSITSVLPQDPHRMGFTPHKFSLFGVRQSAALRPLTQAALV